MEQALIARLKADAALAALFGGNMGWGERHRSFGDAAALVVHLISSGRDYAHDGALSLHFPWVQCDLWSPRAAALPQMRGALLGVMEAGAVVDGVTFEPGFEEAARTMPAEALGGNVTLYRMAVDVRFYWF